MSGLVKGIQKSFKKLSKSKVVKGILIAAAVYYLGGMAANAMGDSAASGAQSWSAGDAIDMGSDVPDPGGTSWAAGDAIDAGGEVFAEAPAPEVTAGLEAPVQAPQVAQVEAPKAAEPPQTAAVQPPASTPAPVVDRSTTLGKAGDNSGSQGAWFKGLSPGAQAIIAGGITGGAGAALQALGTKSAQEDAKAREDRAREDKIRRGSIRPYGASAFTPKGIINGGRG